MEIVWVNVDHVQKYYVIHLEGGCHWVKHRAPSKYKLLNELGKHGGWIQFKTKSEAEQHHSYKGLQHKVMPCGFCFPNR